MGQFPARRLAPGPHCSYLVRVATSDDRSGTGTCADASLRALSRFLTVHRAEIVARWRSAVRRAQGEEAASGLRDPLPDLLDWIAEFGSGGDVSPVSATQVLEQGMSGGPDVVAAITQLVLLRDLVVELWEELPAGGAAALRPLNRALDSAVLGVLVRAQVAHTRVDRALDRLAAAGFAAQPLDAELEALLRILLEEASAIDGAVILLREAEGLRVCAAVGVDAEGARGRVLDAGAGFPGAVAAARGPLLRRWAGDPLGTESGRAGRAVHGLPLLAGDQLVGVIYVISLTSGDFPPDDRRLLRATFDRALAAVSARRLRSAHDEGVRSLAAAEETLRAGHRALSTFAHDLRGPLGVVLMQAAVLLKSAGRAEDRERLARRATCLQRAALRMERLLSDYVAFHEAHAGTPALTMSSVQPAELVRKAADGLRALAEDRKVVLETVLPAGLPELAGDGERLQEALEHLLRSALQVLPEGGRIALRAQHDHRGVVFSVQDSAPPVDGATLATVFERAWLGERPIVGRGGLALAVAKGIVEAHGGRLWATSASDQGNTFSFAVPAPGTRSSDSDA
jgi:signal transduction histidine kinase